ncbi:MAG: DUF4401 domain-containing protein [Leptospirales bacterium]
MSQTNELFWKNLEAAGLVEGTIPEAEAPDSPWFVKVLLGFSAWLGALFLFGFMALGFWDIIDNSVAAFILGAVMIGIAFTVLFNSKNVFLEHFSLAISLAGQCLIAVSFMDMGETNIWLLLALFQVPLAIFMPNFIHKVLSSYFAAFSVSMALNSSGEPYIISGILMAVVAYFWLNEFRYPKQMSKMRAMGYGFTLALVHVKSFEPYSAGGVTGLFSNKQFELWFAPWMGEIIAGGVLLYVVWQLLRRNNLSISEPITVMVLLGTLFFCSVSIVVFGISAATLIILLGFASSNRVLLGLGIISLLYFISIYYYTLTSTLMEKSLYLLVLGLLLIFMRWLMLRVVGASKESENVQ